MKTATKHDCPPDSGLPAAPLSSFEGVLDMLFTAFGDLFKQYETRCKIDRVHHGLAYKEEEKGEWVLTMPRANPDYQESFRVRIDRSGGVCYLDTVFFCHHFTGDNGLDMGRDRREMGPATKGMDVPTQPLGDPAHQ